MHSLKNFQNRNIPISSSFTRSRSPSTKFLLVASKQHKPNPSAQHTGHFEACFTTCQPGEPLLRARHCDRSSHVTRDLVPTLEQPGALLLLRPGVGTNGACCARSHIPTSFQASIRMRHPFSTCPFPLCLEAPPRNSLTAPRLDEGLLWTWFHQNSMLPIAIFC